MKDITTIDKINLLIAILVPAISAVFTLVTYLKTSKEQRKLRDEQQRLAKVQSDIEAIAQYREIKTSEKFFIFYLIELIDIVENDKSNEAHKAFLSCYSSFTDLFNDVNAFCALVNSGSVDSEEVLKNTGTSLITKLAQEQCNTYKLLNEAAEKYGFQSEMKRPDRDAFQEYDKFLEKHMVYGAWQRLLEKRKSVGLGFD